MLWFCCIALMKWLHIGGHVSQSFGEQSLLYRTSLLNFSCSSFVQLLYVLYAVPVLYESMYPSCEVTIVFSTYSS